MIAAHAAFMIAADAAFMIAAHTGAVAPWP